MARTPRFDRQIALDHAVALFWEKGYHATSMKQIEQALDMRPGSIYATFGSKDGLFAEALARYAERGGKELADHLAGYDAIINGLQDYLRNIAAACAPGATVPSRACMVVKTLLETSHTDGPLGDQVNGILAAIETRLVEVLTTAKARGELKPDTDCPRLARLLQAQIIGLRSFAQRDVTAAHVRQLGEDMALLLEPYRLHH